MILVGTAGWTIPRPCAEQFTADGTQLTRYAQVLRVTEINSSFYRPHAAASYANWARQTPRYFRFAVKVPMAITHEQRLRAARRPLRDFLAQVREGLRSRLGPLVVQLPPSFEFEARPVRGFLGVMRELFSGDVALEARHRSWFTDRADALLDLHHVARIAADPAVVPEAAFPGGWRGLAYFRLHGSPRMYWSVYGEEGVARWQEIIDRLPRATLAWCIFDNTASGGAMADALRLQRRLAPGLRQLPTPSRTSTPSTKKMAAATA